MTYKDEFGSIDVTIPGDDFCRIMDLLDFDENLPARFMRPCIREAIQLLERHRNAADNRLAEQTMEARG